jgi:solute carrier family 8 (sodium/calcium exchanger)
MNIKKESGQRGQLHMVDQGKMNQEVYRKKAVFDFQAASIAVPESIGSITLPIIRSGREDNEVTIRVHTIDGTAKDGTDFVEINMEITFEPFVFEQIVTIKIIDDNQWEPDEFFYVKLSLVDPMCEDAMIGRTGTLEVIILDDDSKTTLN